MKWHTNISRIIAYTTLRWLCGLTLCLSNAAAAEMPLFVKGGDVRVSVESYRERQFRTVIPQKHDFSCGSAALATLLKHHYGFKVNEHQILTAMYNLGDKQKILKEGFSLLDMKNYLAAIGIKANGFRAKLATIQKIGVPVIVLINNHGYLHFVVLKGISQDKVLLGDPAIGMQVMEQAEFKRIWNNIVFVILDDVNFARQYFNHAKEWRIQETPIYGAALSNGTLSSFTVHISATPNYFF